MARAKDIRVGDIVELSGSYVGRYVVVKRCRRGYFDLEMYDGMREYKEAHNDLNVHEQMIVKTGLFAPVKKDVGDDVFDWHRDIEQNL